MLLSFMLLDKKIASQPGDYSVGYGFDKDRGGDVGHEDYGGDESDAVGHMEPQRKVLERLGG
jgi:hypothetical protein